MFLVLLFGVWTAHSHFNPSVKKQTSRSEGQRDTSSTPTSPADWKTYSNAEFGYQFSYPTKDVFFSDSGALSDGPLTLMPRQIVNLYMKNKPTQEEPAIINVVVYEKPSVNPLGEWILEKYGHATPTATIQTILSDEAFMTAVAKAQQGEQGVLTYAPTTVEDLVTYEVGAVSRTGMFSYTKYSIGHNGRYVYAVELLLPYDYVDVAMYHAIYKRLLRSLEIAE